MALAIGTLRMAQRLVGGGVIFLEGENVPGLLPFYQNGENGDKRYDVRHSVRDNVTYIRLLRLF